MNAHTTFSRTESPYILYVDFVGESDRSIDRSDRTGGSKMRRSRKASHLRMPSIDLMQSHRILYRNPRGFMIDELAYRFDPHDTEMLCQPMVGGDQASEGLGKTTLRFTLRSKEPFDLDNFEFTAIAENRDDGLFLSLIEFQGKELQPSCFK